MPELLIVVLLLALVSGGTWQSLSDWRDSRASREAARGFAADLRTVAQSARSQRRSLAVEFDLREPEHWRVLADGNGNGVTSADVAAGIDTAMTDWRLVFREGRAQLAVQRDLPSADGTSTLAAGSAPVQLGAAPRLTFTPRGTATAASIYVAGSRGRAYALRVLGSTQRIRMSCLGRDNAWGTC